MRRLVLAALAALALTVAISGAGTAVVAQDGQAGGQGGAERGGQRQRGQQQRFDPEQMRQRMLENMKERLGASDEEWQALAPKVEAVMEAQQDARAGGMGMGMGRGGRGGGQAQQGEQTPIAKAAGELRTVLEDEAAPAEQIRERLDAYRAARKTAEDELNQAREELRGLLTQRQEAMLVMMGMLE